MENFARVMMTNEYTGVRDIVDLECEKEQVNILRLMNMLYTFYGANKFEDGTFVITTPNSCFYILLDGEIKS